MIGWHHWFDGHEFEQALGVGNGHRSLACCSPWGRKIWKWLSNRTELGKIKGKRRNGWQRKRWLDSITDSMDMNLSKSWETVEDRGAWHAAVHGVTNSWTGLSSEQQPQHNSHKRRHAQTYVLQHCLKEWETFGYNFKCLSRAEMVSQLCYNLNWKALCISKDKRARAT